MHGSLSEDSFTTAREYSYNLMCSIEAHDRLYPIGNYDKISGGSILLPYDSTTEVLTSLGRTLNIIDSWL